MSHVEDRWWNGKGKGRTKTARFGKGKRWQAVWLDAGTRRRLSFDIQDAAIAHVASVAVRKAEGTYVSPAAGKTTLSAFAVEWLGEQIHQQPSTRRITELMWRLHILPELGHIELAELTRARIQQAVPVWGRTLNPASTKQCLGYLTAGLRRAVKDRLIVDNPARDVKVPPIMKQRVVPIDARQVHQIAGNMPPRYRALVLLGASTGMRQGEMIGLTIDHLKLSAKSVTIRVDRQLTEGGGFGPLKTPNSYRTITEGAGLAQALRRHIADHPPDGMGLLFTRPDSPLTRGAMGRLWRPAAKGVVPAGRSGWHQLRHHHASLLIAAGLSVVAVADRLGDTIAEVQKTYAHLWPTDEGRIQDAIADLFWAVEPPQSPRLRSVPGGMA